jgi:hypothetical protein
VAQGSYALIADDGKQEEANGEGRVVRFDDALYEEGDEPWEKGDRVGSAHGTCVPTGKGEAVCTITLSAGPGDTLVIHGTLPFEETIGDGELAVSTGRGRFADTRGSVSVEVRNPKRFTVP